MVEVVEGVVALVDKAVAQDYLNRCLLVAVCSGGSMVTVADSDATSITKMNIKKAQAHNRNLVVMKTFLTLCPS